MKLGSGWDRLYHTGFTPECWNETGIRVKSLMSLLIDALSTSYNDHGIRVESLRSHWVDTWNTVMNLGSGWDYLYHTGLTPEVLE